MKIRMAGFVLLFLVSVLAACGAEEETSNANQQANESEPAESASSEEKEGVEAKDNSNEDAETSENEMSVQQGDDLPLPDDFPDDFPLPNGAEIKEVRTEEQTTYKSYSADFVFDQDLESTYQLYKDYAANNDYEISMDKEMPGGGFMLSTAPLANYSFGATAGVGAETEGTVTYTLPD